jgi:CelD/BcsL family acetyltransferase involved in cellulose biosynthesis
MIIALRSSDTTPFPGSFSVPSLNVPANTAQASLALELVTEREAFDALEAEWNALFERAGRGTEVFQTFNWNWHWANHYLGSSPGGIPGLKLSIIIARRDGRLIMVWPLVAERVRGITQIFWMGEPVSQYGDVLIDSLSDTLDVLRAGWDFLKANAKGDIVRLRRVRADAAVAPLMEEIGARATHTAVAPYMNLSTAPSFAEYEKRYTSHARRNRRRLARRMEERGGVTFERFHGGKRARELAVTALNLKAEWLKDRGLVSHAISDARMAAFFADAAEGAQRSTNCVVAALSTNNEPAALEVSFTCKDRLVLHVIVFNLKYEKAGAGVLLLEKGLRDGYAENLAIFDMMAPGDAYKFEWADNRIDVHDWAKPLTLAGQTYARFYLGFVRSRVKAAITGMPNGLRRLMTTGYALMF